MSTIQVELKEHFAAKGELYTVIAQLEARMIRWFMGSLVVVLINILLTLTLMILRLLTGS